MNLVHYISNNKEKVDMIKGKFIRRYKRFFADIELESGEIVTAHCVNTGRMTQCSDEGITAYISRSDNPKRKLRYTLEFVEVNNSPVMVNTIRTNKIVEELLLSGKVQLPFQFDQLKREVKFGEEGSKVDFLLRSGETSFFLEVKNVTMTDNMTSALFPDAVTKRGQKHISELLREIEKGSRGGILFAIQRGEVDRFSPADHIDLEYGELLRGGVKNGLEIIPLKIIYDEDLKPIGGEILEFDL